MTDAEIAEIQGRHDGRRVHGLLLPQLEAAEKDRERLLTALRETRAALRDSNGILESICGEGREQAEAQRNDNCRVLGEAS